MTGAVRISFLLVTVNATMNSFQAAMNVMITLVDTPGAASGRITLRKACRRVHPSTRAAAFLRRYSPTPETRSAGTRT